MEPLERLRRFLLTSFVDEELRRLWARYDREQQRCLPGEMASLARLVDECLALLGRHGIDARFFALLREHRPLKSDTIDELAALLVQGRPGSEPRERVRAPRWYPHPRAGSDRFVGRTHELAQLHGMLMRSRMVGITAQIRGLGGVGKSLLAIEYCRQFGDAWLGGIFWVEADPAWATAPKTADERLARRHNVLAGFAASLGVLPVAGNLAATVRAVEQALEERTAGERHLWIVDDLPPGIDQASIESLLPANPSAALLITTRWMALEALPNRLDLRVLDVTAAQTLLTVRRPPTDGVEQAEAQALAVDVGCHPLALDVLGALVRDELSTTPYSHWRARLAAPGDEFDRRGEALHEQLPTGSERAITRVLATSLTQLRSEYSLTILRVAASLGDAAVPVDLLLDILVHLHPLTADDLECAVADLAAHALVTRMPAVGGLYVHAMVRWVARRWAGHEIENARIDEKCCEILCERFRVADDVRRHDELLALLPHASQVSQNDTIDAVIVGGSIGHFAEVRGNYHDARRHAERALQHFEGKLVPVNPFSAVAKLNLAVALKLLGDPRGAENYFAQALVDYEKLYGREHRLTLMALHNLGTAFEGQGDYAAARRIYEQVYEIQRRVLGPTDLDTLRTLMHLGGILSELGDLVGSRAVLAPAVSVCESHLGPLHPITLDLQSFLAVTLKRQGDYSHTLALEQHLLAARQQTLGPEHPASLTCAQQMAMTMTMTGDLVGAGVLAERTLDAQRRVLGPEHPLTLQTQHNLAVTRILQNDLDAALHLMEPTLAAQLRVLETGHPNTLVTKEDLAWICQLRGDLQRARGLQEEVLAGRLAVFSPGCSDVHQARFKLAETLVALGERSAARVHIQILVSLKTRPPDELSHNERYILTRLERLEKATELNAIDKEPERWVLLDAKIRRRPRWVP